MIKNAIIFAAGFGTRMMPITKDIPKPLIKINDKTLLDIIIDKIIKAGIEKIYINCHYKKQLMIDYISQHTHSDKIEIVVEEDILETGGALSSIAKKLDHPVCLTANTDVIWEEDYSHIKKIIELWEESKMDILMLLHNKNDVIGYYGNGDFNINNNSQISAPKEEKKYMYMGIQIINTNIMQNIQKKYFSISHIYQLITQKNHLLNRAFGYIHSNGKIFHVGDKETLRLVKEEQKLKKIKI